MNSFSDDLEIEVDVETSRDLRRVIPRASRPTKFGRRYGKRPQQFNGMHRRRRKKLRW